MTNMSHLDGISDYINHKQICILTGTQEAKHIAITAFILLIYFSSSTIVSIRSFLT